LAFALALESWPWPQTLGQNLGGLACSVGLQTNCKFTFHLSCVNISRFTLQMKLCKCARMSIGKTVKSSLLHLLSSIFSWMDGLGLSTVALALTLIVFDLRLGLDCSGLLISLDKLSYLRSPRSKRVRDLNTVAVMVNKILAWKPGSARGACKSAEARTAWTPYESLRSCCPRGSS